MKWNAWLRQAHRWISIAFTFGVIINTIAAMSGSEPPTFVYFLALGPLFLLLLTGLYLFALPYVRLWRSRPDVEA